MKKARVIVILLASLLILSGCTGGGGGSSFSAHEIRSFFDLYAFRIEKQDTQKLASMYQLPLKLTHIDSSAEITLNSEKDLYEYADNRTYEGLGWTMEHVRLVVESVNGSGSNAKAKVALIIDTVSDGIYEFGWREIFEFEATLRKSGGDWKITGEQIINTSFDERY